MKKLSSLASAGLLLAASTGLNAATVDVLFAVDSSGSLGQEGWNIEKQYLLQAIQAIDSHEDSTTEYRFGIRR